MSEAILSQLSRAMQKLAARRRGCKPRTRRSRLRFATSKSSSRVSLTGSSIPWPTLSGGKQTRSKL